MGHSGLVALRAALLKPNSPAASTNNLKVLNIGSNMFDGQQSALVIADIIKWHKGIIELDVSDNTFYSAGVSIILMALCYLPEDRELKPRAKKRKVMLSRQ